MNNFDKPPFQRFLEETYEGRVMSYSGRGMRGEYCLAVTLDEMASCASTALASEIIRASHSFSEGDLSEIADLVKNMHVDSLGKGSVCYWPGEEFVPDEEEDEDA